MTPYLKETLISGAVLDGTQLSYPVMYTSDDPEHYLRRDFDGNDSICGVPF